MISRVLSTSKKFAQAGRTENGEFAQLLYAMLLPHADDFGRQEGDPFTVKHKVLPTSPRTEAEFANALQTLHQSGLILWYDTAQCGQVIEITGFDAHQTGLHKRTASQFPGISGNFREIPFELKGTEGKGTEGEGASASGNAPVTQEDATPIRLIRGGGLIRSSLDVEKARMRCAFVGARLDVPHKLHADLMRDTGGADTAGRLLAWYAALDAELEASGEAIAPDVFKWLTAKWKAWIAPQQQEQASQDRRAKMLAAARKVVRPS